MKELLFGTAGIPHSAKGMGTAAGVRKVKELGLGAMELEFVQNVNVSESAAPEVRKAAEDSGIVLTCHGQYYVNLAPTDAVKLKQSMNRMTDAATRMHQVGGWSITWHTAFYLGRTKEQTYEIVKKNFASVLKTLRDKGVDKIWLRPETTGKETQWGDLKECIKLSQDLEGVLPCVDFAHLHARYNGINNSIPEWRQIMTELEKELGRECLDNMHIQVCGINYGPKGEKNHLNLEDGDLKWQDLLKVWKEYKIKGVVIAESPNIEDDAMMLQKAWRALSG
jgi:deoxyribonuclease-4